MFFLYKIDMLYRGPIFDCAIVEIYRAKIHYYFLDTLYTEHSRRFTREVYSTVQYSAVRVLYTSCSRVHVQHINYGSTRYSAVFRCREHSVLHCVQEMPLVSSASSVQFYVEDLLLPVWLNHLPENLLEGTYSIAYSPARIRIRTRVQFSQRSLLNSTCSGRTQSAVGRRE